MTYSHEKAIDPVILKWFNIIMPYTKIQLILITGFDTRNDRFYFLHRTAVFLSTHILPLNFVKCFYLIYRIYNWLPQFLDILDNGNIVYKAFYKTLEIKTHQVPVWLLAGYGISTPLPLEKCVSQSDKITFKAAITLVQYIVSRL